MAQISILVPAFNAEKFISETISSILKQDFTDFELIIINDKSTDQTKKIVKNLQSTDSRIKLLNLPKNKGRAGALNAGIKKAKGKYLAFLDADDLMPPSRLSKQFKFLEKTPKIDLVYGDMEIFYENRRTKIRRAIEFKENPEKILKRAIKKLDLEKPKPFNLLGADSEKKYIPGGTVTLRKKIFSSKIKLDENLKNSEDYDLWLQIISHGYKLKRLPMIGMKYRRHPEQKSKNSEKMLIAAKYINKKLKSGKYFN